jgi:heme-degrading monooxygenase HmoA
MKIQAVLGVAVILVCGAFAPAEPLGETAERLVGTVARLRGLTPRAPIRKELKTREEIRALLGESARADIAPDLMLREERMLRRLGLIPEGVPYGETLVRLRSEQVESLYDPGRGTLFIASWLPAPEQEHVLVHEIALALQDQHFGVAAALGKSARGTNSDRSLALEAFIEGDSTAVMLQHLVAPQKRHFADLPNLAFVMQTQMEAMKSHYEVLKLAPRFLQETVMFPYGYGPSFLQQAWKRKPSWDAVNAIYADPPESTEQIMHPEKYFGTRDIPRPVDAEPWAAALGEEWKVAHARGIGEVVLGLLLGQHLTDERARKSARGWGGDQALLVENRAGKTAVLILTEWDTEAEAAKFYEAMQAWFHRRSPKAVPREKDPEGFSLVQDGEVHALRRGGLSVRVIVGLPESEAPKLDGF